MAKGGAVLLTADHGNADKMYDPDPEHPFTAHTTNPVPFLVAGVENAKLREGGVLADIAPTMLKIMGLPQPEEMTGKSSSNKLCRTKNPASVRTRGFLASHGISSVMHKTWNPRWRASSAVSHGRITYTGTPSATNTAAHSGFRSLPAVPGAVSTSRFTVWPPAEVNVSA